MAVVRSGASERFIREKADSRKTTDSALGVWEAIKSICSSSWGIEYLENIVLVKLNNNDNIKIKDLEYDPVE